jgi:gliding motility-associated-like protein
MRYVLYLLSILLDRGSPFDFMQRQFKTVFTLLLFVGFSWAARSIVNAQWHIPTFGGAIPNSATSLGQSCFQMTPGASTQGVVWDSTQIDLSQPFDITLSINQQPFGADGVALVLQNAGLNGYGAGGNALGFGNSIPATPGYPPILNSVAFEVDTWDNSAAGVADIPQDHVAIHVNGNMANTQGTPVAALASGNDITDGLCHQLRVTWTPATSVIRIYFDANPVPRITRTYNMVTNVFGGNPLVWWGITGSSGGAGMIQTVCVDRNFASAGADRYACAGDTVRLRASGGTSYTWTPGALLSNASIANPVFGPSVVGNYAYQVSVINSALCTDIDSVTVHIESIPVANAGLVSSVCLGDSALLGVPSSPGLGYLWQPSTFLSNAGIAQPWLRPSVAGTFNYNLIVTNTAGLAGCADTAALSVIARDTPTVAVSAMDSAICQGEYSILSAIGNGGGGFYTFAWSNGPTTDGQVVFPVATTTYTVQVNDAFNCQTAGMVTVIVEPMPVANPGLVSDVCLGDSVRLGTAALPGRVYLWQPSLALSNPNIAQPWATPLVAGPALYTLIVSNAVGIANCADTATLAFTVRDTPTVSIVALPDTICLGGTSLLTAVVTNGSSPYAYAWVNGPTTSSQSVTPLTTTPYSVHITDAFNCVTDGRRILVVADTPTVSLSALPDTICAGLSTTLTALASNGTPGYQFAWSSGGSGPSITLSPLVTVSTQVTVTDAAGCTSSGNVVVFVTVTDSLAILNPDTLVCLGGQVQIANTFYTSGINAWQWSPTTGVSNAGNPNPVIAPTSTTTYVLQGTNITSGCGFSDSVTISYVPLGAPALQLGADTAFCEGVAVTLMAGNPGFSYLWSDGSTGATYVADSSGWVWLQAFDTLGCGYSASDSVLFTVYPLPVVTLPADTALCPTDSVLLSAGILGVQYLWNTGATSSSIWAQSAGTYWVQVTDSQACSAADSLILRHTAAITTLLSGLDPLYCISDSAVQLSFSPAGGFFGGPVSVLGNFDPGNAGAGFHLVSYAVTDSVGCAYADTLTTMVQAAPTPAQAGPDQFVTELAQLAANAPSVGNGSWSVLGNGGGQLSSAQDPAALLTGLPTGTYTLVWSISNPPCPVSRDSVQIVVEGLSLPSGFSPNGDGVNDQFVIRGISAYPDAQLSVFNRWGNLVWQRAPYSNDWDGRNATGQALVDDTYYAILTFGDRALNTYVVLKRD